MTRPDDILERLISRKLDGELTEDDSLELDKCLIRDPAARQSLEESERIDHLTAALLEEVCTVQDELLLPATGRTVARRRMRWFGAFPAAAAACIALFFMWPTFSPPPPSSNSNGVDEELASAPGESATMALPSDSGRRLAGYAEKHTGLKPLREHGTRLNYYGVLDPETQKLYLLEVKHQTSTQRPNQLRQRGLGQGGVRLASHEM